MTPAALRCLRAEIVAAVNDEWDDNADHEPDAWTVADAVLAILTRKKIITPDKEQTT